MTNLDYNAVMNECNALTTAINESLGGLASANMILKEQPSNLLYITSRDDTINALHSYIGNIHTCITNIVALIEIYDIELKYNGLYSKNIKEIKQKKDTLEKYQIKLLDFNEKINALATASPENKQPSSRPQVSTQSRPPAQVSTQSRPPAQVSTQSRPSAPAPAQSRPSAQVSTQSRPSAQVSTQSRPSAPAPAQSRPSAQVSTQSHPSAPAPAQSRLPAQVRVITIRAQSKSSVCRMASTVIGMIALQDKWTVSHNIGDIWSDRRITQTIQGISGAQGSSADEINDKIKNSPLFPNMVLRMHPFPYTDNYTEIVATIALGKENPSNFRDSPTRRSIIDNIIQYVRSEFEKKEFNGVIGLVYAGSGFSFTKNMEGCIIFCDTHGHRLIKNRGVGTIILSSTFEGLIANTDFKEVMQNNVF